MSSEPGYRPAAYTSWAPTPEGIVLSWGSRHAVLRGPEAAAIRAVLDPSGGPPAPERTPGVDALLTRLVGAGALEEAEGPAPDRSYRALRAAERGSRLPRPPTAGESVVVHGWDPLADRVSAVLRAELERFAVPVVRRPDLAPERAGSFAVVVAAPGQAAELPAVNETRLSAGLPWLLVDAGAAAPAMVGPLLVPGRSGCLECYLARRASLASHPVELHTLLGQRRSGPIGEWLAQAITTAAAGLVLGFLLTGDETLAGTVAEISTAGGCGVGRHHVLPVPGCRACAVEQAEIPGQPVRDDGELSEILLSRRTGPAAQLVEEPDPIGGWVCSLTGTAVDLGHGCYTPVSGSGRHASRSAALGRSVREFVERLVLREPPDGLPPLSAAHRDAIPCPLADRAVDAVELATGARVRRPAAEYYLHPTGCGYARRPDRPSTSGAATGDSYPEALERALLELLERDALMLAWRWSLPRPGYLPDEQLAHPPGFTPTFLDLSYLHRVPVIACVARGTLDDRPVRAIGSAADRTRRRAARRALDEAAAVFEHCANRAADAPAPGFDSFLHNAYFYLHPGRRHLVDGLLPDTASADAGAGLELGEDARSNIDTISARLAGQDITVYAADLTPRWLRGRGLSTVVTRSPDLYPLEVGAGDPHLAARMGRRAARHGGRSLNLAPVPLA